MEDDEELEQKSKNMEVIYCQGTFNFTESSKLHFFFSFVFHFSRILSSLSVPIKGTSGAVHSSHHGDQGKGYLLGFLPVNSLQ